MGSDSENEKSVKERKKFMAVAPISKPLAGRKLCKRTLKLVRRGIGRLSFVPCGWFHFHSGAWSFLSAYMCRIKKIYPLYVVLMILDIHIPLPFALWFSFYRFIIRKGEPITLHFSVDTVRGFSFERKWLWLFYLINAIQSTLLFWWSSLCNFILTIMFLDWNLVIVTKEIELHHFCACTDSS